MEANNNPKSATEYTSARIRAHIAIVFTLECDVKSNRRSLGKFLTMVIDYSTISFMDAMPISKFKATCLAVLQQVHKTGRPIRITRRGEPIADVVPPGPRERPDGWLGSMADRTRILGDITVPSSDLVDWEVEAE